ncbi:cytochrome P450 [Amycolatopsis ultiminotia]|uniref:Cytochrome P450 n=1 Tax=Amycolatopsis ultiminotia TaxID=543629 RepID=A0ABP6XN43_9PSEU
MNSTETEPLAYPFNEEKGLGIDEAYALARETPGLLKVRLPYGEPVWLVTRYADARTVFSDPRFSRAMVSERDAPRLSAGRRYVGLLEMDPPEHSRLRALLTKAFTMRRIEAVRPRIARHAATLIAEMKAAGPPVDLVENYALSIPVIAVCEMLGVPLSDRPKFRVWSDAVLSTSRLTADEFRHNLEEIRAYIRTLLAEHRADPRDDLMTALIEARDVGDRLSELELVDMCSSVLVAGHETTAGQIANFVHVLHEHPQQWRRLCADPDLAPDLVEELLRFIPFGSGAEFPRYAKEDVELGGTLVRAGEPVLAVISSANRDPDRFEDPATLCPERTNNHHVSFGHGPHHCIGAPLARLELQEALRALAREMPDLHIAGEVEWKTGTLHRGPEVLPVSW